jgi:heavy metal sensor kinase
MFFEKILRLRGTLAFRLTLWYAGIFTLSALAAFVVFYFSIASIMQQRTDRRLSNEIAEFAAILASKGMPAVKTNIDIEAESHGVEEIFFRVLTPDGREIASSNMWVWKSISARGDAVPLPDGIGTAFETVVLEEPHRIVRVAYGLIAPGIIMQIGESLIEEEEFMEISRRIFGISLSVLMIAAALAGWFMARRALQGVEKVTKTALAIAEGSLELRVSVTAGGGEIVRLAQTFNSMLDRIHALITGMREMTDNIAHDLRSPITRIRGVAEMTLTGGRSSEEYQSMAANTIEECDCLLEMINTMLDITEVEAGTGRLGREEVDISHIVREACDLFQPVAEDKKISLLSSAQKELFVKGDKRRLQRLVSNLLDNALKYTSPAGGVTVSAVEKDGAVLLSVRDTGIGISEKDLPHIFTRFYRCDQSRSQAGTGLGLSLAKAIAEAHGGSIGISSSLGKGSVLTVSLPSASRFR